jgi:WD40 repeat protein
VRNLHATVGDDKKAEAKASTSLSGHAKEVYSLTILPDGRLASGSEDNTIKLWNVKTGACEAMLSGHTSAVMSLTVLPDGRLVSGSWDNTIKFWNVKTGACEATLSEHTNPVCSLTILPDGRLASASRDKTIKLWNVKTGLCEATLSGHTDYVVALTALSDGRLASGSYDKTICFWTLSTPTSSLTVPLSFQSTLRVAYLNLTPLDDGLVLILSQPSKDTLQACVEALQILCADLPFKATVTDQHLQLNGLSTAQRDEVVKVLKAFLTVPAPVSGHSLSLLGVGRGAAPAVPVANQSSSPAMKKAGGS